MKSAMIGFCLALLCVGCSSQLKYKSFEAGDANYPRENKPVSFHSCNKDDCRADAESLIMMHQKGMLVGTAVAKDSTIGGVRLSTSSRVVINTMIAEYEWDYQGTEVPWALSIRVYLPDRTVRYVRLRIDD